MILKKVNYEQNINSPNANPWFIDDLQLTNLNLIVGKNATGKSMALNLIHNLSLLVLGIVKKDGAWELEFKYKDDQIYTYYLNIQKGIVANERIKIGEKFVLDRSIAKTTIHSEKNGDIEISPPSDKLVINIRRDKKEFPFFEPLYEWAESVQIFRFSRQDPRSIQLPIHQEISVLSLEQTSLIFERLSQESLTKVIEDLNYIGYPVSDAELKMVNATPLPLKVISIREKGLEKPLFQMDLSEGMHSTFALLIGIYYFLEQKKDKQLTILIDDLNANLDYERSLKLSEVLFKKIKHNNLQIISTTNDRFLMNTVDIKYWNILTREGSHVKSKNYENSKKLFDKFELTGLNNFELFSSDFLLKNK